MASEFTILGAGLLGRLMAWRLLVSGQTVTLIDKDLSGKNSAGLAAAAMLAPVSEALDADEAIFTQGINNLSVWPLWVEELRQLTQQSVECKLEGSLIVAHSLDRHLMDQLATKLKHKAFISRQAYQPINNKELNALEPILSDQFDSGFYFKPEGYIDNQQLFNALKKAIDVLGGQWIEQDYQQSDMDKNASFLIDTRGIGSKSSLNNLRAVRGEIMTVQAPEVNLNRPVRLLHPRYQLYISPRSHRRYVIGATQIESSSEAAITVRSSLELLSALYAIHPGFGEAHILDQQAKLRPAFDHHLPEIQFNQHKLTINGLYRHGYLLAPSVIEQALNQIGIATSAPWPAICHNLEEL